MRLLKGFLVVLNGDAFSCCSPIECVLYIAARTINGVIVFES